MSRFFALLCIFSMLFPSGCTDIRTRSYAELLAIRQTKDLSASIRNIDEDTWISSDFETMLLLPDALESESGKQLSFGHLDLLMLQGETLAPAEKLLSNGLTAPNCPLLLCAPFESMEMLGDSDISGKLHSAVENGALPPCSVGEIVGNLESRAGMTILPYCRDGELHAALHDGERLLCVLSEEACRGVVLSDGRSKPLTFSENGEDTIEIRKCRAEIRLAEQDGTLTISVTLRIRSEQSCAAEAAARSVQAFFEETVLKYGADPCFLEESARRFGVAVPTRQAWRTMLQNAVLQIQTVPLSAAFRL